jgi:hypothetical protein
MEQVRGNRRAMSNQSANQNIGALLLATLADFVKITQALPAPNAAMSWAAPRQPTRQTVSAPPSLGAVLAAAGSRERYRSKRRVSTTRFGLRPSCGFGSGFLVIEALRPRPRHRARRGRASSAREERRDGRTDALGDDKHRRAGVVIAVERRNATPLFGRADDGWSALRVRVRDRQRAARMPLR